jgi:MFS family permease
MSGRLDGGLSLDAAQAAVELARGGGGGMVSTKADTRQRSVHGAGAREVVGSRRHRRAFWMVAFAFLAVMAFAGVPSPLYGLYRARDHFSLFMVTVAFAVYAVGVIGALLLAGHVSDWYGRRPVLLPALGIAIASALVFVASKSLAGLLTARVLNGISVGLVASTATAYLAELNAAGRPGATARRAQLTSSAINVGGLGVGALVAGCLAQWVAHPLTVPYLVFLVAPVLGAIGVALAPETREGPKPRPRYRPQRLSVPGDERSTLASHVSPKVTILDFAIAVSVGIVASAVKLAGGPPAQAPAPGWR